MGSDRRSGSATVERGQAACSGKSSAPSKARAATAESWCCANTTTRKSAEVTAAEVRGTSESAEMSATEAGSAEVAAATTSIAVASPYWLSNAYEEGDY
jgi:hypothetical protein